MPYTRPAPNGPGTCPSCARTVLWTLTSTNRKPMMVDPDRDEHGNVAVRTDAAGRVWSRQLSKERPSLEGGEALHMPHVATCPVRPLPRTTPRQRPRTVRRSWYPGGRP